MEKLMKFFSVSDIMLKKCENSFNLTPHKTPVEIKFIYTKWYKYFDLSFAFMPGSHSRISPSVVCSPANSGIGFKLQESHSHN